jgi:hypothetical protein
MPCGAERKETDMATWLTLLLTPGEPERGEVNTASILAWTMLAVVAILAINVMFDDLVTSVFADVKARILGS